ncbi:hypothetical protein [Nocardia speluncae]|uniref:hypothetical protein n=1 Tax=Nocardia speluncae TaxID=419477 RepID=UPI00082DB718|nr:hypothetical protein [Nocardia speluncae]
MAGVLPDIGTRDPPALRQISRRAAPASTTLLRTMIETFPQTPAFGQTECSPMPGTLRGDDAINGTAVIGVPYPTARGRPALTQLQRQGAENPSPGDICTG